MGPAVCLEKINQSMISPCQQSLKFPAPPQYFVLKNLSHMEKTCSIWKTGLKEVTQETFPQKIYEAFKCSAVEL